MTDVLTEGVRRSLEDARDTATRNIEWLERENTKLAGKVADLQAEISRNSEEIEGNKATRQEAETLLGEATS